MAICDSKMEELKCCVLIPTYNNAKKLESVLQDVLKYTSHLIVVNDGSTDNTLSILEKYPQVDLLNIEQNQGKGNALRKGFKYTLDKGFQYAITLDSDGQHFAKDIPTFLEKIEKEPNSLIVGARNMDQSHIPGKSTFGHKFSNFWFRFETHIDLPDTQSGYRLYPLEVLNKIKFFTKKFEFEVEVIVKAAWKDVNVTYVPVQVFYPEEEERITHFRPLQDFTRISILNTYLVTLALLYYKPMLLYKAFKKKK